MISVALYKSPISTKKYRAVFQKEGREWKQVDFGGAGYRDFTLINDKNSQFYIPNRTERQKVRRRQIERHARGAEDWDDPQTSGALSRYVLWERPTLEGSWDYQLKRFDFVRHDA